MPDPRFFGRPEPIVLAELARLIDADLSDTADPEMSITDVAPLETADAHHVSFFENRKYLDALAATKAGAVILAKAVKDRAPAGTALLLSDKPYQSYALAAQAFHPIVAVDEPGIDAASYIDDSAVVAPDCQVDAGVVIGAGASIGARSRVRANAVIGPGVEIGKDCDIGDGASLSHSVLGDRVTVHPGVRIGQDGFGFAPSPAGHTKVPQLGRVIIENDVEIGANSTIDRGSGPDTVIGAGSKIDNLVQIGHNVRIGRNCLIVAQVGISGSTQLGDFVVLAGQVGISGHLKIGNGAILAAKSGLSRSVPDGETFAGIPARPVREWRRISGMLGRMARRGREEKD